MRPLLIRSLVALAATAAFSSTALAAADPLPRKAALGIQLNPGPGGTGVVVGNAFPGGTAASLGVRNGDTIRAVNGKPVASPDDVVAIARALHAGAPVTFDLTRAGAPLTVSGKAMPRPFEQYRGATVDYGSLPFRDGRLRDVLVMPEAPGDAPVLFYIQGYSCGSIEGAPAGSFYHRLGEELIARGIGFYRVEKLGEGDSIGSLKCVDADFAAELEGFKAAYRHLLKERKIAPERIFMLGHSMGGIQAPFLAAETAPRGVAAYGTVVRNWADYHHDLDATQNFLIGGADPAQTARDSEANRDLFRLFYFEKMSPAEIVKARPDFADALRNGFAWDGKEGMFGRHYKFAQQLAALELIDAWKNSKTNVLALYGKSDMVALTDVDHRYLADIANYWRPGSGTYVEIADTGHGMELLGTRAAIRERNRAGGPPLEGEFNPKVADALSDWIKASLAKPPLAG